MLRRLILGVALLCLTLLPLAAQDTTPPAVRDAALNTAQEILGTRATNWQYTILQPTDNSNLGCLLVEGETMAQTVTPYRVVLSYPDGDYVIHVSADGSMTQLCDEKFGTAVTANPAPETDACVAVPVATLPLYAAPSNAVPAIGTLQANTEYVVLGQANIGVWLQVGFDGQVGWVETLSVQLSTACPDNLDITGYAVPDYPGDDCFVTPFAAFSNVRARPTTESQLVAQVFENSVYQTTAVDPTRTWYFIGGGWVSQTVVRTIGDFCESVPVSESLVGEGFADPQATPPPPGIGAPTNPTDTSVSQALATYPCPLDYESNGYLPPRLQRGNAIAAIEEGGLPNTLRTFPTVNDEVGERIGTIQPGRTIDLIVNGPVCNQGIVWWYVEIDGTRGWTAESNNGEYYMIPTGTGEPIDAPQTGDTADQQAPTSPSLSITSDVQMVTNAFITMAALGDDTRTLYVTGFYSGDGGASFFGLYDIDTAGNAPSLFNMQVDLLGVQFIDALSAFAIADASGTLSIYSAENANLIQQLPDLYTTPNNSSLRVQVTPSGNAVAITRCATTDCARYQLALVDVATGAERWTVDLGTNDITSMAISADERRIAVATTNDISFYDVITGDLLARYNDADSQPLLQVAFNPTDATQLLFGACAGDAPTCPEGRIGLVDTTSGNLSGILTGFDGGVDLLAFTPDGMRFVSRTSDTVLRVHDSATGNTIASFDLADARSVTAIDITDDNRTLVVTTFDGRVVQFQLPE